MPEARPVQAFIDFTEEPIRRGSPDKDIRLDFKGNFHRVIEVTDCMAARQNARRGK